MSHIQFTRDSRVELAILLNARKSRNDCARILGMNRTSVWREIELNKDPDGVYRGGHAHKRHIERKKASKGKSRKIENDRKLRRHVVRKIKLLWSPEQIAGRLKRSCGKTIVCHETIYSFIYEKRPDLVTRLRHQKCKYRKKRGTKARMELNRASKTRSIDERPVVVDKRSRCGDWEDDTVVGKERVERIWTCVERKSGFGMGKKMNTVTAESMHAINVEKLSGLPDIMRKTLTRDNGLEFGDYDSTLERKTGMKVYRAHAYSSNERPGNENWNGLLRQFFPKGTPFANITDAEVQRAIRMLNDRPRKRLGYLTPREAFRQCCNSS